MPAFFSPAWSDSCNTAWQLFSCTMALVPVKKSAAVELSRGYLTSINFNEKKKNSFTLPRRWEVLFGPVSGGYTWNQPYRHLEAGSHIEKIWA